MLAPVLLDPRTIIEFLAFLRVHVDTEPGDMNILGLQGMTLVALPKGQGFQLELNNNAPNIYNDVICVAFKTKAGLWDVRAYTGTVDPGNAYLNQPGGQAHLTFGQHMYVRGSHMGHPALRAQNEINRVWRDKAKTGIYTHGDELSVGPFGVDVHAGGAPGDLVNNWSAGCVNICGGWAGPAWIEFMLLVNTHFECKGAVGVTIWSGKDLCRYSRESDDVSLRPTLRFGMLNPWVAEMQKLLQARNYFSGVADGDWGDFTQGAVEGFQYDMGLVDDGICGPSTWQALQDWS